MYRQVSRTRGKTLSPHLWSRAKGWRLVCRPERQIGSAAGRDKKRPFWIGGSWEITNSKSYLQQRIRLTRTDLISFRGPEAHKPDTQFGRKLWQLSHLA